MKQISRPLSLIPELMAAIGLATLGIPSVAICQTSQVTVHLFDAKSGKPLDGVTVVMNSWNGDWDSKKRLPEDFHHQVGKTDKHGTAKFAMTQPLPAHVDLHGLDIWGCSEQFFLTRDVMTSGVTARYVGRAQSRGCYEGSPKSSFEAKPGEIVIYDRKINRWRLELP